MEETNIADPVTDTIVIFGVTVATEAIIQAVIAGLLVAAATPAINIFYKSFPKIIRNLKRKLVGQSFLVVGPPQVGKSSFLKFVIDHDFADTHPLQPTVGRPRDNQPFTIDEGANFKMDVRKNIDFPGELNIDRQLDLIKRCNPNALIIFTVALPYNWKGKRYDPEQWLSEFLEGLNAVILTNQGVRKNLRSITVVINKKDQVKDDIIDQKDKKFKQLIKEQLGQSLGGNAEKIPVIPCTLYKRHDGEKFGNAVKIAMLAQLRNKKALAR